MRGREIERGESELESGREIVRGESAGREIERGDLSFIHFNIGIVF